ncbi:MAG: hypothetical protein WKF97_18280 [Chitinophagaceae bacterium]
MHKLFSMSWAAIVFIIIVPCNAFAQKFILGKIISATDQSVVAGATILLKGTRHGVSTDVNPLKVMISVGISDGRMGEMY